MYAETTALENGSLSVRLNKQLVEDGVVIWSEPHRVVIEPGQDVDAVMQCVFDNLSDGVPLKDGQVASFPVEDDTPKARVKAIAAVEHTPERVQKFQKDKADREARQRGIAAARRLA